MLVTYSGDFPWMSAPATSETLNRRSSMNPISPPCPWSMATTRHPTVLRLRNEYADAGSADCVLPCLLRGFTTLCQESPAWSPGRWSRAQPEYRWCPDS